MAGEYCKGYVGEWEIFLNFPVVVSPALPTRVRWRYGSGQYQEVVGDSFTIELIYGGWYLTAHTQGPWNGCIPYTVDYWITAGGNIVKSYNGNQNYPYPSNVLTNNTLVPSIYFIQSHDNLCGGTGTEWNCYLGGAFIDRPSYQTDSPSIDFAPLQYKFTIWDNSDVAFEYVSSIEPEAYVLEASPMVCEFDASRWEKKTTFKNYFPNAYLSENVVGSRLQVLYHIFGDPLEIPYIIGEWESEEGCPAPLLKVECKCEECPPDTCSVLDRRRNKILCANLITGCVVKEIDYNNCQYYDGEVCI